MLHDAQADVFCCQSYLVGSTLYETLHFCSTAAGREVVVSMRMPQNCMAVMQVPVSKHAMNIC